MKPAYFHLKTADNDDVALGEAKVLGHVPDTCLLGGAQVWKAIRAGFDPCITCLGPRERCGGRYSVEDVNRPVSTADPAIEAAFRAFRDSMK